MEDVMLDLETLGNGPNSVIIAIGAVKFDVFGLGEEFYEVVDAQSCIDAGLQLDVSTVMWWMRQSDAARAEFQRTGGPLTEVLQRFTDFLGEDMDNIRVWGNGASFDNVILGNAYRKAKLEQPWKFYNDRCYRTVKNLFPLIELERTGTAHNALDDAKTQAKHLINMQVVLN